MNPFRRRSGHSIWRGYTIVEITIGAALLSLFFGLVFQMFNKSQGMAAKGVWRVQSMNELRLAIRQVRSILSASSYPTFAGSTVLDEVTEVDTYKLNVGTSQASGSRTSGTDMVFDFTAKTAEYSVLTVWNFTPVTDTTANPPCVCYTLKMSAQGASAVAPNNRSLVLQTQSGTYTITSPGQTGHAVSTTMGTAVSKVIVRDVEMVRVTIPGTDTIAQGLFSLDLVCRDPVDARLTHTEAIRVEKNVAVKRN